MFYSISSFLHGVLEVSVRFVLLALILSSSFAYAAPKHAPLPDAVYKAKTVFIVNQSGYQSTADGAYEALTKWGALTVVSNRSKADLIMTFSYGGDELVKGTTSWGDFIMTVQLRGTDDAVFQASSGGGGFHIPSNRGGFAAKDCVSQFKKRFAEPH
jgi:hypothetical protein